MVKFATHPPEEALEEYAFDRLPESAIIPLEEHILVCESCQMALARVDEYIRLMKTAAAQVGPRKPTRLPPAGFWTALSTRSRVALFAAGFLVLSVAVAASRRNPSTQSEVSVVLTAFRGSSTAMAHVPAHRALNLTMDAADVTGSSDFVVQLVNAEGAPVWTGATKAAPKPTVHVRANLPPGLYWARLYAGSKASPDGLLREFGLRLD